MKQILNELVEHRSLSKETARQVLIDLASGKYNASQMSAFMTVYMMRAITIDELQGFRDAMLELCIPVKVEAPVMDVCGTGGDGKNTFNISTLSSFVVAAAGQPVAKHGNYGVSSVSGSSNVLEYFGYKFSNDHAGLERAMNLEPARGRKLVERQEALEQLPEVDRLLLHGASLPPCRAAQSHVRKPRVRGKQASCGCVGGPPQASAG